MANVAAMNGKAEQMTREERLAAKLRENLKRRKTQAKAMAGREAQAPESDSGQEGDAPLSNPHPKS